MSRKTKPKPDRFLRQLAEAYLSEDTAERLSQARLNASMQLEDLAMHQPEAFWECLLLLLERRPGLDTLVSLATPLTWLLRLHPDQFDERVAGLARRDSQMWDIVSAVDRDRIAPDVSAKLGSK